MTNDQKIKVVKAYCARLKRDEMKLLSDWDCIASYYEILDDYGQFFNADNEECANDQSPVRATIEIDCTATKTGITEIFEWVVI